MLSVAELAKLLQLPFQGEGAQILTRVSNWEDADGSSLIFLDGKTTAGSGSLPAGCVIATSEAARSGWTAILSRNPKLDFARAANHLLPRPRGSGAHHSSAVIAAEAIVEPEVDLAAGVVISARARVGRGSILHPGVVIGHGSILGEGCILHPRVVLYPGAELGNRVTVHAGTVIGGDGFGYVFDGCAQVKFPQVEASSSKTTSKLAAMPLSIAVRSARLELAPAPRSTTWCRSRTTSKSDAPWSSPLKPAFQAAQ